MSISTLHPTIERWIIAHECQDVDPSAALAEEIAAEIHNDLMRDVLEGTPGPIRTTIRGYGSVHPARPKSGPVRE